VISFRLHPGGAQTLFGVAPDLTVLGKIIGGGYPIGAVAGKAAIMRRFDPSQPDSVTLSGTFHANPVALAAGLANMKLLTPEVIDDLNRRSEAMTGKAAQVLARARLPLRLNALGSLFCIHATAEQVTDYRKAAAGARDFVHWLYLALLNEGILLSPRGMGCVSAAMQPGELDRFVQALEAALAATGALGQKVGAEA
jgi:glutamate-1-semialdehyde 2,1-aminomutase